MIRILKSRKKFAGECLAFISVFFSLTIIFILTMSVISSNVVGVQIKPIWSPFPDFFLAFGDGQASKDERLFLSANVLMTFPLVAIARSILSRWLAVGLITSLILAIEISQYSIADGRTFGIGDLIANGIGVGFGVFLAEWSEKFRI